MILPTLISFVIVVLGILVILSFPLYLYFRKQYQYWKIKNVPCAKPIFPFGNMLEVLTKSGYVAFKKLYEESKHQRYQGIWLMHKPVLMINDPDLVHQILIKNFSNFYSNGSYFDKDNNPFSETLFTLEGAKWKNLRAKLSPIFTSGKVKAMFPHLMKCSENLQDRLQGPAREKQLVDATDFTLRLTADVVFSVIFGVDRNFLKSLHSIADIDEISILKPRWILMLKLFFAAFVPEIAKTLKYGIMPKKSSHYFINIFREILKYRQENGNTRNDIMQLLIQLLEKGYIEDVNHVEEGQVTTPFNFQDLISQAMTFLAGGFETSTKAFQFALYELAINPEIQKKLKIEINQVLLKHNGQISYEAISEMEYLNNVIDETLRKYSITPIIARKCTDEFKDVGSNLKIEKGEYVLIPISGIHSDERYYPEPEKFDPERFTKENKSSRPHCTYFPFGDGPRFCIGQRFAQLQIRVGLVTLLSRFDFVTSQEYIQNPLKFEPKSVITAPEGKMMLRISLSKSEFF